MMVIINDEIKLNFLRCFFDYKSSSYFDIKIKGNEISSTNNSLLKLIKRLKEGKTTMLPKFHNSKILWLIMNKDHNTLLQHGNELKDLLGGRYIEVETNNITKFNEQTEIGKYGTRMFPKGYLCFNSPLEIAKQVLNGVELWMTLDEQRPELIVREKPQNAYLLRSKFHQAMALKEWNNAREALVKLKEGHYISDENYYFLRIKLLAGQSKWEEIWGSDNFSIISGMRYQPKGIREALLTAFYKVQVMELEAENNFNEVLEKIEQYRNRLGTLLNYKSGLSGELFVRIFAYEATINNEIEKLKRLREETEEEGTADIIERLLGLVEPDPDQEVVPDKEALVLAKEYFNDGKYDDAYLFLLDSTFSLDKIKLLLSIAVMTEDNEIYDVAIQEFNTLDKEEQLEILEDPSYKAKVKLISMYKEGGQLLAEEQKEDTVELMPKTWEEWLKLLLDESKERDYLVEGLQELIEVDAKKILKASNISNIENLLLELIVSDSYNSMQKQLLNLFLPDLASVFLQDPNFPNSYAKDSYHYLLRCINLFCNKNISVAKIFFGLAEGILECDLSYTNEIWDEFKGNWFNIQAIPELSLFILNSLELFKDYGWNNQGLAEVWNIWVGGLSTSFALNRKAEVKCWVRLGDRIGGDLQLLEHLRGTLSQGSEVDYIKSLDQAVITIFSCRESAANRAAQKIMGRNEELDVRVCTDSKLTTQAKSYAKKSDIVIVVTACISHALTYGISPYLSNDPLYPRSSGETGIIDVLEDYAAQVAI